MAFVPENKHNATSAVHARKRRLPISMLFFLAMFLAWLSPYDATAVVQQPWQPGYSAENCSAITGGGGPFSAGCEICASNTTLFPSANLGQNMIAQVFTLINKIIYRIQSTVYKGIVTNANFRKIIAAAFTLYIVVYGIMITFSLASYRTGDVASRLIKVAIIYAMTLPTGWHFFATWVQNPVVGGINQLIADFTSANSSGSGTGCASTGAFSGGPIGTSGGSTIALATGPMAMLYGPLTCIFATKFIVAVEALITTGFYGWVLALMILWGLVDFVFMIFGAIVTYVKAVIGLVFLFGLAPIFMACYLFEKTRSLTQGWFGMIIGFALQPVMLFAFLAFYAVIIGNVLSTMFSYGTSGTGPSADICYTPWYNMPGLMTVYWWNFKKAAAGAAGGQWLNGHGGSGILGEPMPPPARVLNVLYFIVLSHMGKGFSAKIGELATAIANGGYSMPIMTTGENVQGWVSTNLMGGEGPVSFATDALKSTADAAKTAAAGTDDLMSRLFGGKNAFFNRTGGVKKDSTVPRPSISGRGALDDFGLPIPQDDPSDE